MTNDLIVSVEEVKRYIRLEEEEIEENADIEDLILTAQEMLLNATGRKFTSGNRLAKMYVKLYVSDFYDNRSLNEKKDIKVRSAMESIESQLSICEVYNYEPGQNET